MKLPCKITLDGPVSCLSSPSQAYYPIFPDASSSGPHYRSPLCGALGPPSLHSVIEPAANTLEFQQDDHSCSPFQSHLFTFNDFQQRKTRTLPNCPLRLLLCRFKVLLCLLEEVCTVRRVSCIIFKSFPHPSFPSQLSLDFSHLIQFIIHKKVLSVKTH